MGEFSISYKVTYVVFALDPSISHSLCHHQVGVFVNQPQIKSHQPFHMQSKFTALQGTIHDNKLEARLWKNRIKQKLFVLCFSRRSLTLISSLLILWLLNKNICFLYFSSTNVHTTPLKGYHCFFYSSVFVVFADRWQFSLQFQLSESPLQWKVDLLI